MNPITLLWLVLVHTLLFHHGYYFGECCSLLKLSPFDGYKPLEAPLVEWSIPSQNPIACGYLCHRYGGCASFSFNTLTSACTGYSSIVGELADTSVEPGAINYFSTCNVSTSAVFQGFTYGQDSTVLPEAVIPYGTEVTLVGVSGRLQSGTFLCPLGGYYKLLVHALPQLLGQSVLLELRHNGQTAASVRGPDYNLVGNGVILYLETGDDVQVFVPHTSDAVYGSSGESVTTFTAVLLKHQTEALTVALNSSVSVMADNKVIFDHVITDVTQIYDVITGTVTIQTSGLYIVHFFVVDNDNDVRLDLYQNEKYVCSVRCFVEGQLASCGNTAILKTVSGDTLSIRSRSGFVNLLYGSGSKAFTTLSVHLIATEEDIAINSGLDCWDGVNSRSYSGNLSVTQNGYVCQEWAAQTPHAHNLTEDWRYPCDGSKSAALNRCRDPDWTGLPWCLTSDPAIRRERCNVTICPSQRTAVAFSVALSQTTTLNGDIGVGFDHFLYGINCDYSPASRRFTARVSGLYEFHVTATGPADGKDLHLELWTNDRYIVSVIAERYGYPTGGNSALVELNPGDSVFVKTVPGVVNKFYGGVGDLYCIFSGYLVK